jgi:5-methyltetrahydrofolate--homocysteine methyltransferase
MSRLLEALRSGQVLLMDGAMGTELQRAGLRPGACGEQWNLTQPQKVTAIHRAYVEAGACCLLTNTFQANPAALARHGLGEELEAINRAAVELARSAVGPEGFVLGDIGPVGESWRTEPVRRVAASLRGVDGLLLETFSDTDALWVVKYACRPAVGEDIPVFLSLTYLRTADGVVTTHGGQTPEVFARLARQYGVAALGVNCGRETDLETMAQIVRRYRKVTDLPLFARPNAGTPERNERGWVYPEKPERMAGRLAELLEAGVTLVGGCCGTTPAHVAAFRPVLEAWNRDALLSAGI